MGGDACGLFQFIDRMFVGQFEEALHDAQSLRTAGLVHGLGFASVMGHLPFRMVDLLWVVIYFNVGVELGQIAIVAIVFPILFLLRKSPLYESVVLKGVSALLIAVAAWWFVQRAFDLA